jgi:D-sedoheptulose 7-phosphate isomerase
MVTVSNHVAYYLERLGDSLKEIRTEDVAELGDILYRAYHLGSSVFVVGNGGSASTASHMAADLAKNTIGPHMTRFRVLSLNDNMSLLTALANDDGYENVFREQLVNLIRPGDVLIAISASGNSANVLRAIEYANSRNAQTVGLLGFDGGRALHLVGCAIHVQSRDYGVIEDAHLILNHILVEYFQRRLAEEREWQR